jgi:predicted TPR repeat methyltransferase
MSDPRVAALDGLDTPDATRAHYDGWAASYDTDLASGAYAGPARVAAALAALAPDPSLAVLDLGCGTGLSGQALAAVGFGCIDGADFSPAMLERAAVKNVYRRLVTTDLSGAWPFAAGDYGLVTAVGALTPGHLPPRLLGQVLAALPRRGLFAFTWSDRARRDPAYAEALADAMAGGAETLWNEEGPHLPAEGMQAAVIVLGKAQ